MQTTENAAGVRALEAALEALPQVISKAHDAVTQHADEGITAAEPADVSRYLDSLCYALVEGERDTTRIRRLAAATSALGDALGELTAARTRRA